MVRKGGCVRGNASLHLATELTPQYSGAPVPKAIGYVVRAMPVIGEKMGMDATIVRVNLALWRREVRASLMFRLLVFSDLLISQ